MVNRYISYTHYVYKFNFQIRCQRDKINCPDGFYREMLTSDLDIFTAGTVLCHSCHELCGTCTRGPKIDDCNTCKFVRSSNLSCAYYCDPNTGKNDKLLLIK